MDVLTRNTLELGGFAGLRERIYVMDARRFGDRKLPETQDGLGQLVYLADAIFVPHGNTRAHDHSRIDIVSVIVRGRLRHEGSLGHGEILEAGDVQVQYAGAQGFRHDEINPDPRGTHMIQLWLEPRDHTGAARYRTCRPKANQRATVYGENTGGFPDSFPDSFSERVYERLDDSAAAPRPASTVVDIWPASAGQQTQCDGPVLGYLVYGSLRVTEGDQQTELAAETLFRGEHLTLETTEASLVILATSG